MHHASWLLSQEVCLPSRRTITSNMSAQLECCKSCLLCVRLHVECLLAAASNAVPACKAYLKCECLGLCFMWKAQVLLEAALLYVCDIS